jgi:hypothetical protein
MAFRKGQWVKTSTEFPGAHKSPDGRCVGIYQPAYADSQGNVSPEHVAIVKPDGTNLRVLEGSKAVQVSPHPSTLADLVACETADVPQDRPGLHNAPGRKLKP